MRTYFKSAYRRLYRRLVDDMATQRREVEWIARHLGWREGDWALDLACGYGRHLCHLREIHPRAVGVDLAENQLQEARAEARAALGPAPTPLLRGDMFRLPFADGSLGAILLLFNSFGYRSDAADTGGGPEIALLREITRALRPGGAVVLEIPSINHVRAAVAEDPCLRLENGDVSIQERWALDAEGRMLVGETTFAEGERAETVQFFVRLFTLTEMNRMALDAGLRPRQVFGDLEGAPFQGKESNQLVLVLEKAP